MDEVRVLLELIDEKQLAAGRLAGVFHILIGRKITKEDGTVVSNGITWRELASVLKVVKFDKKLVEELSEDPEEAAPRDREKMWYLAIGLAKVGSVEAHAQADKLAALLKPLGYHVGPAPSTVASSPSNAKKK